MREKLESLVKQIRKLVADLDNSAAAIKRTRALVAERNRLTFNTQAPGKFKRRRATLTRQIKKLQAPVDLLKKTLPRFAFSLRSALKLMLLSAPPAADRLVQQINSIPLVTGGMGDIVEMRDDLMAVELGLMELLKLLGSPESRQGLRLSLPKQTPWDQITIEFLSEHVFTVVAPGFQKIPLNYADAGFEDKRTGKHRAGKPNTAWELLRILAEHGSVQRRSDDPQAVEKPISDLRKRLRRLLGLDGDPFFSYRSGRCYRPRFKLQRSPTAWESPSRATDPAHSHIGKRSV
jgi:hypothetical protein